MQSLTLAENVAFGVAAQPGVQLTTTPFYPGRSCVAVVSLSPASTGAAGVIKVQSSPDNATWTDQLVCPVGLIPDLSRTIQTDTYMRANQTVAYTAGTYSVYLLADN